MHRFLTIISLILILSFFSIQAHAADKDIVAKVGDRTITLSDVDRIIAYAPAEKQKQIQSNPQLKEEVLKQYVYSIILSDLAKKKGFDQRPEIKEKVDFYKDSMLANEFLKEEVSDKLSLSEEGKLQYYKSHQDEFTVPEMVKARHILILADKSASPETRKKAREKAVDILQRLQTGEDFAKIASELSDDPSTKTKGGDIGFFSRGMIVKPIEEAAFSLNPGEISGIIETQSGYEIIKVEEKKASYLEPYDAVKDKIAQKHLHDNIQAENKKFLEKSMKDAGAVIYPEKITGTKQ
jgi:peptidyl-prolyl cis-trans isomerase C